MEVNFETIAIRNQSQQTSNREHSVPLYLTSSFTFESAQQASAVFNNTEEGLIYSRFTNPNTNELVNKLCAMENCESGIATASGMAAVYTSFAALLEQGDHVVVSKNSFGTTLYIVQNILTKMGVEYTLVEIDDEKAWKESIRENTKLAYVETPSNPTLKIADLQFFADLCKAHNVISIVDNCFASPYLQKPADFGVDLIIHSATKYIDGQGRVIGGAVLGKKELVEECYEFTRRTGACLSPFNAWILSKSLETLGIRMDRHCSNALTIAEWLSEQPNVESVSYPFLDSHPQCELAKKQMTAGGGLVGFSIKGNLDNAMSFINGLKIHSITSNLGDSRSIITHPASTTHSKMSSEEQLDAGITPNYLRISVGLENVSDLIADLEQSLKAALT